MLKVVIALTSATMFLAACGEKPAPAAEAAGPPVVSASETPRNPAVDTTPTTGETTQTPGANSFTEGQARSAIESAGYTAVGPLSQDASGIWMGKATKGGAESNVSVDYKGAVTPQ